MKSRVKECYDYKKVEIADELRRWHIPDSEIEQELEKLAKDHSGEEQIEGVIEEGDSVRCICTEASADSWKGRVVLLYPGRRLPGAEEAEKLVSGRKKGESISCRIGGVQVSLRIEDVIRRNVMGIGDELASKLGLPGVHTVEDYYRWYHGQKDADRRQKACNVIVHEWLEAVAANSEFEIDEEEKKEWALTRANVMYRGMMASGYDPKKQPDGTVLSEEEALAEIARGQEEFFIPYLIYCYFCESNGFVVTEEDYLAELRKLAKEQGLTEEEALQRSDLTYYRQVTCQEHTFLKVLGPEAEKYLED